MVEEITPETSWLVQHANQEHIVQSALAKIEAARTAKILGEGRRAVNGLGRARLEIPDFAYHYWGQRLGYKCWKDKQFLREFERDNPACRVQSVGTKLQVGYGSLSSGASKRFTKAY